MPRKILPNCFKSFKWRLLFFFVGSALCIGIVIPYDDPTLAAYLSGEKSGSGTSAAVPYTIAMQRMHIHGLPHLINAILALSILSCGNGVLFAASRALFVMGKTGRAPGIFAKTTRRGIPVYSVGICLLIALLAMMGVDSSSNEVLHYFIDLCTVCGQFNYFCLCVTYVHWYYNLKRQGISRDTLPYKARFQPYAAIIGATAAVIISFLLGFNTISPFEAKWFFLDYTLLAVFPIAVVIWKYVKKTKYVKVGTADLALGGAVKEIDDYEDMVRPRPEGWVERFFSGMWSFGDIWNAVRRKKAQE